MDWDDVRVFLAIARAGHLLGAAKRLRVNHATVARRLNNLEAALQVKLVVRRPTGCRLTEEGERLLAHAERMESEFMMGCSTISHGEIAIDGTVRIGAPDGFATMFLAPRLASLKALYPGLRIQLVQGSSPFSLSRRDADIAITIGRPQEGRVIARKLVDYTLGLFAARDYLARAGAPTRMADLQHHATVGSVPDLTYSAHGGSDFLNDWRSSDTEINNTLSRVEAVRAGAGIGVLHHFIAKQHDDLVQVLPEQEVSRSYWLASHETMRDIRRISAASDFIAKAVAKETALFRP